MAWQPLSIAPAFDFCEPSFFDKFVEPVNFLTEAVNRCFRNLPEEKLHIQKPSLFLLLLESRGKLVSRTLRFHFLSLS